MLTLAEGQVAGVVFLALAVWVNCEFEIPRVLVLGPDKERADWTRAVGARPLFPIRCGIARDLGILSR